MKLSSLIGQTLDDKYLIDKQLGKGGMGAVYLATHIGTGRPVAVKVIAPQFMANDEFVERFKREAKAAGRLRHPNVVNVTDFGFAQVGKNRLAYLVMEYLDGCSLGDILAEESRLPLEWVVDILEQACSAVEEAHRQGIVHRDLKPDNIWLEPNRRGGYTVKVLDFGLAKLGDPVTGELPATGGAPTAELVTAENHPASTAEQAPITQAIDSSRKTRVAENQTQTHMAADINEADSVDARQTRVMDEPDEAAPLANAAQTQVNKERGGLQTQVMNPGEKGDEGLITSVQAPRAGAVRLSVPANRAEVEEEEEAQTLIQSLEPPLDEAQTRIQTLDTAATRASFGSEEGTQILDSQTSEEERTRILTDPSGSTSQDSSDGLTRVGSVLGTPLYMSPEQCNSLPLDWRTDIYSLGVIGYQMLTGATPFAGEISAVMRQHVDASPPPFRDVKARVRKRKRKFKIPRRVEDVIMQALAKNREERPPSAAAFAGMLRSGSEGAGALLRRAVALYSEYFPKFFAVSLIVNLPSIILLTLQIVSIVLVKSSLLTPLTGTIAQVLFSIIKFFLTIIAGSVLAGVTVRMVVQLMLAPLRPIRARKAFVALKKRLRPLILTVTMVTLLTLVGFILCLLPGVWFMIVYAMTMPVVVMENLSGRKAMRRAKQLARRSWRTVSFIVLIQLSIPFVSQMLIGILIALMGQNKRIDPNVLQRVAEVIRLPIDVLAIPLISIMTALLYLMMRQSGGENLNETLAEFEAQDMPTTKWQARMRDRMSISTPGK